MCTHPIIHAWLAFGLSVFRSRQSVRLENLALRHQLAVYQRTIHRPCLHPTDRLFWAWLARLWLRWQQALIFVQPRTVIAWQRKRFREHWTRLSRRGKPGRPAVAEEVQSLIRRMSLANPTWGVPRIVGELRKLGIHVAKSTVERYRVRPQKPAVADVEGVPEESCAGPGVPRFLCGTDAHTHGVVRAGDPGA